MDIVVKECVKVLFCQICSIWVCAKWVHKLWILSEKSKDFDKKRDPNQSEPHQSEPNQSEPNQSEPNQSNWNFLKSPRAPWSYFWSLGPDRMNTWMDWVCFTKGQGIGGLAVEMVGFQPLLTGFVVNTSRMWSCKDHLSGSSLRGKQVKHLTVSKVRLPLERRCGETRACDQTADFPSARPSSNPGDHFGGQKSCNRLVQNASMLCGLWPVISRSDFSFVEPTSSTVDSVPVATSQKMWTFTFSGLATSERIYPRVYFEILVQVERSRASGTADAFNSILLGAQTFLCEKKCCSRHLHDLQVSRPSSSSAVGRRQNRVVCCVYCFWALKVQKRQVQSFAGVISRRTFSWLFPHFKAARHTNQNENALWFSCKFDHENDESLDHKGKIFGSNCCFSFAKHRTSSKRTGAFDSVRCEFPVLLSKNTSWCRTLIKRCASVAEDSHFNPLGRVK